MVRGNSIRPKGIAINALGSVFVTDTGNHRVEIFDASGNFLGFLGNASFYDPEGIAISPTGTIYVAERDSYTIDVFSANATSIGEFGTMGQEITPLK